MVSISSLVKRPLCPSRPFPRPGRETLRPADSGQAILIGPDPSGNPPEWRREVVVPPRLPISRGDQRSTAEITTQRLSDKIKVDFR